MSASTFFIIGLTIAILLIIEAFVIQKNKGRFTLFTNITSSLELLWFVVCIYALFTINFRSWNILIPAAYLSYFIVASWHYRDLGKDTETMKEIIIPPSSNNVSLFAGILLLLLNGIALWQLT